MAVGAFANVTRALSDDHARRPCPRVGRLMAPVLCRTQAHGEWHIPCQKRAEVAGGIGTIPAAEPVDVAGCGGAVGWPPISRDRADRPAVVAAVMIGLVSGGAV